MSSAANDASLSASASVPSTSTTTTTTVQASSSLPLGPILGRVLGGTAVIALVIWLIYRYSQSNDKAKYGDMSNGMQPGFPPAPNHQGRYPDPSYQRPQYNRAPPSSSANPFYSSQPQTPWSAAPPPYSSGSAFRKPSGGSAFSAQSRSGPGRLPGAGSSFSAPAASSFSMSNSGYGAPRTARSAPSGYRTGGSGYGSRGGYGPPASSYY